MFNTGGRIGVALDCSGERLVALVVRRAVEDLEIREGVEVYAAIKATAFRQLG
jgi:molybdate transport system ATP-binding protein